MKPTEFTDKYFGHKPSDRKYTNNFWSEMNKRFIDVEELKKFNLYIAEKDYIFDKNKKQHQWKNKIRKFNRIKCKKCGDYFIDDGYQKLCPKCVVV